MIEVVEDDPPMTVRQVYYQLVGRGVIEKTETEYKHTVVRLLTKLRRERRMPSWHIADNTRWMRKPKSFTSIEHALTETAQLYRRAVWATQPACVEIWLEKEALSGVLYDVTAEYDVPLMVTRGYASESFLYSAGEAIAKNDKPTYLYYLGDHDPSGRDIPRVIERRLREEAPDAELHFERIAVTSQQIKRWRLPTRPTKTDDSRAKGFRGRSVEVDAIPPDELRALVEAKITSHIRPRALKALQVAEESERGLLKTFSEHWWEA